MTPIAPATFHFLADLTANNNREWFAANRTRYDAAHEDAKSFLAGLVDGMNRTDDIEHSRMYRIYRDVRFSKDKTPYNPRFGMSLSRRKPLLRGGYFLDITPAGARISCGFWGPNKEDMALIRGTIDGDGDEFRDVVEAPATQSVFGKMHGQALKTAPRGFKKDHPHIDLLRYKQFLFTRRFDLEEAGSPGFPEEALHTLSSVRPFFDYMSDVLAHDLNGEPLY